MNTPNSSRIAIFNGPDEALTVTVASIPDLKPGELLVRNEYCTLCRSDLHTYEGNRREKTPTILGHEIAGSLVAFGPDSARKDTRGAQLQIGDRLTWAIYASAPEDPFSRKGIPQKAASLFKYGHERITETNTLHGGLSDYTILRKHTPVAKLSPAVPPPVAALINCSVATVAGALRLAGPIRGERVLISGVGMLGIFACAMAKSKGVREVIAMDINTHRLQTAKRFGADSLIQAGTQSKQESIEKVHTILEFSGMPSAMEQTLSYLDIGGSAIWVGAAFPQRDLHLNAETILRRLWTIRGLHNYNREDFIAAVDFIEKHASSYPFTQLVEKDFELEKVNEAFRFAVEENPFRVGIRLSVNG